MGDRREQMRIVGPDFRLARLESGRGVNGVAGSQGNVGRGEHPNAPKSMWRRIRLFHPNELATDVVLRSAPAVSSGTLP